MAEFGTINTRANLSPSIATFSNLNKDASVIATTIITPPANGIYRVGIYIEVTAPGISGTILGTIGWTDDGQAQSFSSVTAAITGKNYIQFVLLIKANTSADITYSTTAAGVLTGLNYNIFGTLERLL